MRRPKPLALFDWADQQEPPAPDYVRGLCDCGWLLLGAHMGLSDTKAGKRWLRHLTALPLAGPPPFEL